MVTPAAVQTGTGAGILCVMLRTLRFDRFYALVLQVETHLQVVGPKDREGPGCPSRGPTGSYKPQNRDSSICPKCHEAKENQVVPFKSHPPLSDPVDSGRGLFPSGDFSLICSSALYSPAARIPAPGASA